MPAKEDKPAKPLATNRKAFHDYMILERREAGIELRGTEVKSIRNGEAGLAGSFARVKGGEVFLFNANIPPYEFGNRFNHDAMRPRRLLLHRQEIHRMKVQSEQKGHTIVPLSLYIRSGHVKVELAVCRGKRAHDKRETMRRRTADMEAKRAIARSVRRGG
jgi:SsrA-binding protein